MKRYLLLAGLISLIAWKGYSQCTPDTSIHTVGIKPDSATNLPHAIVGIAYSTVMQVKVPHDSTIIYMSNPTNITIDSFVLTQFTGLPPGYNYSCNPNSCVFPQSSNGCILIQGPAPLASQAGMIYPLQAVVVGYGYVTAFPIFKVSQPDTINYYFIQVDANASVNQINGSKFTVSQNNPNPFSKTSLVEFYSPSNTLVTIKVANMLGSIVMNKSIWAQTGNNRYVLSAKDFEPGIYFYTLSTEKQTVTKRMVISNE